MEIHRRYLRWLAQHLQVKQILKDRGKMKINSKRSTRIPVNKPHLYETMFLEICMILEESGRGVESKNCIIHYSHNRRVVK